MTGGSVAEPVRSSLTILESGINSLVSNTGSLLALADSVVKRPRRDRGQGVSCCPAGGRRGGERSMRGGNVPEPRLRARRSLYRAMG